jgi:hypothetical protein
MFGIKVPDKVENGTFYYSGDNLNAKITYRITAKLIKKYRGKDEEEEKEHKTETFVRIYNHLKSYTLQKVLYDETNVTRFLCFGGGVTNLEVEFLRDTYCVSKEKLTGRHRPSLNNYLH